MPRRRVLKHDHGGSDGGHDGNGGNHGRQSPDAYD